VHSRNQTLCQEFEIMSEPMKRTMQNITIASEVPNFASASASKVHQDLHQNYICVPVLLLEEGRQLQEQ
jgi:hypothetical protein